MKSTEIQGNTSGDTDMRLTHMENSKVNHSKHLSSEYFLHVAFQSSPPMTIEEDGPHILDNQPTVVSPKSDETSKGMRD